jgi:predicted RNA methylase
MAKLSKQQLKNHQQALELVDLKRDLDFDERHFVLENFCPGAGAKTYGQMFFTPMGLAGELAIHRWADRGTVVDIGAGIGALTRFCLDYGSLDPKRPDRFICIERSVENVRVGKKVVPEAEWIQADAFDPAVWAQIGEVEYVISNPPFGNVPTDNDSKEYKDFQKELGVGVAHLKAVGLCRKFSAYGGTFILPQGDLPFEYSGRNHYHAKESVSTVLAKFMKRWPNTTFNCQGIDCSVYENEWQDASPKVELVYVREGEE